MMTQIRARTAAIADPLADSVVLLKNSLQRSRITIGPMPCIGSTVPGTTATVDQAAYWTPESARTMAKSRNLALGPRRMGRRRWPAAVGQRWWSAVVVVGGRRHVGDQPVNADMALSCRSRTVSLTSAVNHSLSSTVWLT
jgi:hypothetical protein